MLKKGVLMFSLLKIGTSQKTAKNAFTLTEIMSVVAGIMLIAGVAIPSAFHAMRNARDNGAIQNLRTISLAFSDYAAQNSGKYPNSETQLIFADPPYLSQSYCNQTKGGFTYYCNLDQQAYQIAAVYANMGPVVPSGQKIGYYVDQSGKVVELGTDTVAGSDSAGPPK